MIKKLTAFALCASLFLGYTSNISAKSPDLINGNMDYRRSVIMEPALKAYVKTHPESYPFYGAKFEPRAGIYIGTPYNKLYPGIQNALNTQYDWFVPNDEFRNENCPRTEKAEVKSSHTKLRGYNLNFALKNSQVINIEDFSNHLYNKIDELASWGEDILLIFGKEMNIDDNFNDPELFKHCFRFVADYAHTKENIAMVWAPNDTGGLDTTLEEYYPGDEYVDWVGCSLYTMPFFQGNPNADDGANMSFIMGEYANPSMRAKLIHKFLVRNNIHKPVMITEGGVGFESPDGTDYTEWAKHQLRLYYADICRAYPEFKCIISFNEFVYPGDLYRYDISNNPALLEIIQNVTSDPIYLKSYPSSADFAYTELFDGMIFTGRLEVSAYAYIPKKQDIVVRYLLDGEWLSEKTEPPYTINLTNSDVPYGWHTLTLEVFDGTRMRESRDYQIELIPEEGNYVYAEPADNGKCTFSDMAGKPSEMRNAVGVLKEAGVLTGVDENNFAPDRKISRSELAAILMRLMNLQESETPSGFTDIAEDDWYYGIINAAVGAGLINGYDDNTFRGGNSINRNEFITIAAKLIMREKNTEPVSDETGYTDEIDDWVSDYVKTAKSFGIILERADGIFCGTSDVTRGDAAVMINRLYTVLNTD